MMMRRSELIKRLMSHDPQGDPLIEIKSGDERTEVSDIAPPDSDDTDADDTLFIHIDPI